MTWSKCGGRELPPPSLPKGVHRVKKITKNGPLYYFYAWRGGPNFWTSTFRDPRDPEFLIAFADAVRTRFSSQYMPPQMVDDFLDSTAMPTGERTKADYRLWALRFAHEFADDPAKLWENPKSRGELNEWRAKWKDSPEQPHLTGP
ncbi:site-specific integrase, partial [Aliiroseovarius halocynthiae]